jgi:3-oxoacyl-(acyl-carrier-protein) synthase
MPQSHPSCLIAPVHISRIECRTALGDADETVAALLNGEVGLKLTPAYGADGGEKVPLALRQPMQICLPPRWWDDLKTFMAPLAESGWGTARQPVFLTSSNFGIDGLYGLSKYKEQAFTEWSTPQSCAGHIREALGWGNNISIYSHACVSAQLGLYQAALMIQSGFADRALVLSFDYVGPFVAAGFHSLKILNEQMPAPFQEQETGSIGLGDGIAYAVLERDGTGPCIQSQSLYNEMYHFTSNKPDGEGFRRALESICEGIDSDRFWIKGHGTGTLEAGKMEADITHAHFPGHPLVSWKGSIGHTLGSCALVELAIGLAAQKGGQIPGTVGSPGPCFGEDVATSSFAAADHDSILMLSNAFGGAHGAMFVRYA